MMHDGAPSDSETDGRALLFAGLGPICDAAMVQTKSDGAALAVLTPSTNVRELVYATDPVAQQLDELQYLVGEGPCFDAYLDYSPQFHPELASAAEKSRWPTFAADATQLGVHALFAFPVPDGRRPMGILELYRENAGSLTEAEYAAAAVCAVAIAQRVESNWRDLVSRFGGADEATVATVALSAGEPADPFSRRQVHVAGGMVAVQLGIHADEGVDRLRAYAYACGRSLSSVAADIIGRRLTLRDQPDN
jgi:GAF domain